VSTVPMSAAWLLRLPAAVPRTIAAAPAAIPALIEGAEYWLRPEAFIQRCLRSGDRFPMHLPGAGPMLGLTHPDDIKRVLTTGPSALQASPVIQKFFPHKVLFGEESIVGVEGEEHMRMRRLQAPPLHGAALPAYEGAMERATERALATWPYGERVSFRALTAPIALEITIEVVFGATAPERTAALKEAAQSMLRAAGSPRFVLETVIATMRGGRWEGEYKELRAARAAVDTAVTAEIEEREAAGRASDGDVLGLMLQVRDDDGKAMSRVQILNAMAGLLLAGYETTSTTLGWFGALASREPEVLRRLERAAVDGDDDYIDAVIAETLRLRPPGIFTFREVVAPFALDDETIVQPGTIIAPVIAAVHRRPDIYPDPDRFLPDRFVGVRPGTYTWLPFGGGNRRCLGGAFAMFELRVILRTMFRAARMRHEPAEVEPMGRNNIILVPRHGAMVTLDRI